ncbi:hydroxymethylbilane synthase, partial [Bacillus altitudinis]|uniref:hydroxymethylbilane synthase n=1 Tax=Bacillus altitudinis TaxID=293387 RepID=UPI00191621E0
SLIGPKRYDAPWKEIEAQGYISPASCYEVRIDLPNQDRLEYAASSDDERYRLAATSPAKTPVVRELIEKHRGEQILVIGQYIDQLDELAASLDAAEITGATPVDERERLYDAFRSGEVDVLVHSLKDLPTAPYPGLTIGAVPKRADARDVLVARNGATVDTLPDRAKVGTGSPRRAAQLRAARPDLDVVDIRGNIDTRLGRVDDDLDAVVLAAAGLGRIDRLSAATELLDLGFWPSAPGQGALAVEIRTDETDRGLLAALRKIEHAPTRLTVTAEREVLAKLEAGCSAPIGATAVVDAELLLVSATVYRPDGTEYRTASHAAVLDGSAQDRLDEALAVGGRVATELLENGAAELADLAT